MVRVLGLIATLLAAACAVTSSTCPVGAKLVAAKRPEGRAQWCEVTNSASGVPLLTRSYDGTLGLVHPTGMPGGVDGPFTSWHPDGTLASHGSYENFGARSVPDGLWTFWYPDGRRRVLGRYRRGTPQGCFAVWDARGKRETGIVEGDQLRVETCTAPADDEVVAIESGGRGAPRATARADFQLQGMAGPNQIGAANPVQVAPDPRMTLAVATSARKHFGRLRVGPVVGIRVANDNGYLGLSFGGAAAWRLPTFHPRIDTEVSFELAAQRIAVNNPNRSGEPGIAEALTFWAPLPALQLNLAVALSPHVEVMVGARVDGVPARDETREMVYCEFVCLPPVQETWSIGGFSYGVVLGLRFSLR